jgi:hypothetical protein
VCGPSVVSSPEISETRARPVMRERKKGEGERGAARWGPPVREREMETGRPMWSGGRPMGSEAADGGELGLGTGGPSEGKQAAGAGWAI